MIDLLSRRELRIALLLGLGYSVAEVSRRLNLGVLAGGLGANAGREGAPIKEPRQAVRHAVLSIFPLICRPEQQDHRHPSAIVAVWAARNYENIQARIRAMDAETAVTRWRALPDVVTEARLGVA